MDPILGELRIALCQSRASAADHPALLLGYRHPRSVSDLWDADYWCANVREPVRFADTVKALVRAGNRVFVEVGPHPVLSANIREVLLTSGESGATISTLDRDRPDADSIRHTIAGLYAAGALDVTAMFGETSPHFALPRYPWQRQRLLHELPELRQHLFGTPNSYAMLGDPDFNDPFSWELQVSGQTLPWLADHVVEGRCMLPGAAYLDAALSATSLHTRGRGSSRRHPVPRAAVVDPVDGAVLRTESTWRVAASPSAPGRQPIRCGPCMPPRGWSRERTLPPRVPSQIPAT